MKNSFKYLTIFLLGLAVLAGCKKEDEDDTVTKLSLTGNLTTSIPTYVLPGDKYVVTFEGMSRKDGGEVGYIFRDPFTEKLDTVKYDTESKVPEPVTVVMGSQLGEYTAVVTAFASGYYDRSVYANFTIIDNDLQTGCLQAHNIKPTDKSIITADGEEYYYTRIGDLDWFRQNVRDFSMGYSYSDSKALDKVMGRYYNWKQAQVVCPDGWRLPSEEDFASLAKALGCSDAAPFQDFKGLAGDLMANATFLGKRMWTYWRNVDITDKSSFCAIPTGYVVEGSSHKFKDFNVRSFFWTSDEKDGSGVYRSIYHDCGDVLVGTADEEYFSIPVRCVRNAQ